MPRAKLEDVWVDSGVVYARISTPTTNQVVVPNEDGTTTVTTETGNVEHIVSIPLRTNQGVVKTADVVKAQLILAAKVKFAAIKPVVPVRTPLSLPGDLEFDTD